ncbi:MAG: hypothetical protein QGG40_22660, partial [Myxococcota bacterium]|nr:hypothetical protein [Myxococcota bacterium]
RVRTPILALILGFALVSTGCGDSTEGASTLYVRQASPLFKDNESLAKEFLELASKLKKEESDEAELLSRIEYRVLPKARRLARRSARVVPQDEDLAAGHLKLTASWEARALVYAQLVKAWKEDDMQALDSAILTHARILADEDLALEAINKVMEPYQLELHAYP